MASFSERVQFRRDTALHELGVIYNSAWKMLGIILSLYNERRRHLWIYGEIARELEIGRADIGRIDQNREIGATGDGISDIYF